MAEEDDVVELVDSTEYLEENAAMAEIKKILEHPGIRDRERLYRRLWLFLQTKIPNKF